MGSRQHNFYNDAFRRAGYADAAVEVQRLWLDGKRDEAAARVPDELVLKTNLLGTEAMVRERLAIYRARRHHHAARRARRRDARRAAGHPGPADGPRQSGLRPPNGSATDRVVAQMLPPRDAVRRQARGAVGYDAAEVSATTAEVVISAPASPASRPPITWPCGAACATSCSSTSAPPLIAHQRQVRRVLPQLVAGPGRRHGRR